MIDTGIGMDGPLRARIFEPFFTTQRVGEGTGLGLSIVLGVVRRCGGAIDVATAPGQGSAFHVFLPLCDPAAGVPVYAPAPADRQALVPAGARILVLDDDEVVGITVEALLSRAGYGVCRRDGATAALGEPADPANNFAALVTDFVMPERSGLEVCRAAAALRPGLPMVLISGHLDDEVREQAARLGVCGVVRKEYVVEELVGLLQGRAGMPPEPLGRGPAS